MADDFVYIALPQSPGTRAKVLKSAFNEFWSGRGYTVVEDPSEDADGGSSPVPALSLGDLLAVELQDDPDGSFAMALRAAYAHLGQPGRKLATWGDSLIAGKVGQATPQVNNVLQGSPLMYACMASLGRLEWGGQFGVPNQNLAQILARAPQVIAAKPDMCLMLFDDSSVTDLNLYLPQMIAALADAGIEPVLCTLLPSSSTNALTNGPHNAIRQANGWITKYAVANRLRLVDLFGALVDPATGKFKAGHNDDITHPSHKGYRVIGQTIAAALSGQVRAGTSYLPQAIGDGTSFAPEGLFVGGTTAPTGWYVAAGGGGAHVTDAFFAGRGFQLARTDASTKAVQVDLGSAAWTFEPGDLVAVSCKIKTVNLEATGGFATISVPNNNRAAGQPDNLVSWQVGADFPDGGVVYYEGIVPPGTNGMSVQLRIDGGNGSGDSVTFSQFALRSLTKLGYVAA